MPFYFIVDEAQEIGSGMRLESMLSEGAKFGARMFVLAQSLSMMRKVEGMEPVVQAMLANTSTQMFFSPDPEDAELIRATLSSTVRYGNMTFDLPSLQCWLRARIGGRWQPPTLTRIKPLPRADGSRVKNLIEEVIAPIQGITCQRMDGRRKPQKYWQICCRLRLQNYWMSYWLSSGKRRSPNQIQNRMREGWDSNDRAVGISEGLS